MTASGVAKRFAHNLRGVRESADLTQEELAFRAGLHRTEVGLLERAERTPRIDTLAKLAGALRVETTALLDGITWEPGDYQPGGFVEQAGEGEG